MDPLEDVLGLLEPRSHLSAYLEGGPSWALRFDPPDGVKFNAVRRGACVLEIAGVDEPIALAEGDCYLLTRRRPYVLRAGGARAPRDARAVFEGAEDGVARVGEGDDVVLVGGGFSFGARAQDLLLDQLPPVLLLPAGTPHAETVRWALDAIEDELRLRPPAATIVAGNLAVVMLVHVLRLHLARQPSAASGLLAGLADPVVATALTRLHSAPAHPWTVAELAAAAAVSRSTLAARFRDRVGTGPLEYLTRWRLELAARELRSGGTTLAAIARSVGYGSESALSVAFKRLFGVPPGEYRRRASRGPGPDEDGRPSRRSPALAR